MNSIFSKNNEFVSFRTSKCIKGLAAIMIMFSHFFGGSFPWFFTSLFPGWLWVGVFFFFSGYGLRFGYENKTDYLKGFIKRKVLLIYLPFCGAELIYALISNLVAGNSYSIKEVVLGIIGINLLNGVLWYVIEILALYLLFFVIYKTIKKDWVWIPLFVLFLALCVFFDVGTWWYISTSAFVLGIYYQKFANKLKDILAKRSVCILSCSITLILYAIRVISATYRLSLPFLPLNYLLTFLDIVTVPMFIVSCACISWKPIVNGVLEFLGGISYYIYLLHMASLLLARYLFKTEILAIIFATTLTIAVSALYRLISLKVKPSNAKQNI